MLPSTKRLSIAALTLLCGSGCGFCDDGASDPPAEPELPPLTGEPAPHGIDEIVLSSFDPGADEGGGSTLRLRRDGCFRTESSSSDGARTTVSRCAACSTTSEVTPIFRTVADHLAAMQRRRPGKSGTRPIALGASSVGRLRVATSAGEEWVAGEGDEALETVARELYVSGVPGAPELTDADCVSGSEGSSVP